MSRKWYDEVIVGFKQEEILKTVANTKAIAEYRVVYDVSLLKYDYYSLQVFSDGTGEFTYMVHKSEDFSQGEIVLNETKTLNPYDIQKLINVIKDSDFFDIPTVHPDESLGLDGTTIFIEGFDNSKYHFISMWEPDNTYGIYKIHKAFSDFADTIAERPIIDFD